MKLKKRKEEIKITYNSSETIISRLSLKCIDIFVNLCKSDLWKWTTKIPPKCLNIYGNEYHSLSNKENEDID